MFRNNVDAITVNQEAKKGDTHGAPNITRLQAESTVGMEQRVKESNTCSSACSSMPPTLARLLSGVSFLAAIAANFDANARWSEIRTSSGLYLQSAMLL